MLVLKQQQYILALTEEVKNLNDLVQNTARAKRDNDKDKEVVETISKSNVKVSEMMFQCKVCDYKCQKEETLKKQTNTKHQYLNHEKTDERNFYCHECNVSFKTKRSFKKHKQMHHDIVLKNCSEYDYECTSKKD